MTLSKANAREVLCGPLSADGIFAPAYGEPMLLVSRGGARIVTKVTAER